MTTIKSVLPVRAVSDRWLLCCVKAAQRASVIPALPIADDDPAWSLPPELQPHFVGEYVWIKPTEGTSLQMGIIAEIYRDGTALVNVKGALCSDAQLHRARLLAQGYPQGCSQGPGVLVPQGELPRVPHATGACTRSATPPRRSPPPRRCTSRAPHSGPRCRSRPADSRRPESAQSARRPRSLLPSQCGRRASE